MLQCASKIAPTGPFSIHRGIDAPPDAVTTAAAAVATVADAMLLSVTVELRGDNTPPLRSPATAVVIGVVAGAVARLFSRSACMHQCRIGLRCTVVNRNAFNA
jgi:hypothetical protein